MKSIFSTKKKKGTRIRKGVLVHAPKKYPLEPKIRGEEPTAVFFEITPVSGTSGVDVAKIATYKPFREAP